MKEWLSRIRQGGLPFWGVALASDGAVNGI